MNRRAFLTALMAAPLVPVAAQAAMPAPHYDEMPGVPMYDARNPDHVWSDSRTWNDMAESPFIFHSDGTLTISPAQFVTP